MKKKKTGESWNFNISSEGHSKLISTLNMYAWVKELKALKKKEGSNIQMYDVGLYQEVEFGGMTYINNWFQCNLIIFNTILILE